MLLDADIIREKGSGKCVEIIHYLNDGLWKLEMDSQNPR
jgi:predicted ribosome-associated RNA-binding protein Tma20